MAETRRPEEQLAARPAEIWVGTTNTAHRCYTRGWRERRTRIAHIYTHTRQGPASKGTVSPAARTRPTHPPPGLDTRQKACPGSPSEVLMKRKPIHESAQALAAGSFTTEGFSFQLFSAKPFTASGGEVISRKHGLPCGEFPLNLLLLFNPPNLKGSWPPPEVQRHRAESETRVQIPPLLPFPAAGPWPMQVTLLGLGFSVKCSHHC